MKSVNLRKAAQISNEIQVKINQLTSKLQTSVEVKPNAALDVEGVVNEARLALTEKLRDIKCLLSIRNYIRNEIANANASQNESTRMRINSILADMVMNDARIKILNTIIDQSTPAFPWAVYVEELAQKAEEMKMDKVRPYGYSPEVKIALTSQSFIDELVKEVNYLKSEKNQMSDELIRMNITTCIEIGEIDWEFLTKLGIV